MEGELKQYKSFESRVKQEIGEKVEEIGRLNSTLNETQDIVEENERIRSRLEKEIEKSSGLTKKVLLKCCKLFPKQILRRYFSHPHHDF